MARGSQSDHKVETAGREIALSREGLNETHLDVVETDVRLWRAFPLDRVAVGLGRRCQFGSNPN
jgi:hypothetical protein